MLRSLAPLALILTLFACEEPPDAPPPPPESPPAAPERPPSQETAEDRAPEPSSGPTGSATPPPGYPEGFAYLPGGTVQPSPAGPPGLRTITIAYPQSPTELAEQLRGRLEATGWTVSSAPPSPRGTLRMTGTLADRSVRASILPGPPGMGSALLLMP